MLESSLGFTEIHTYFIRVCLLFELPREALPIIDYTGLFKTMSRSKTTEFLYYAAETYLKLVDYRRAHEMIKRFFTQGYIEANELALSSKSSIFYMHTVLAISQGESRLPEATEFMKMHSDRIELEADRLAFGESGFKLDVAKEARGYKFFFPLREWRKLSEEEAKIMKEHNLLEVYNAGEWKGLGRYIGSELRDNNWRVKSSSVKNVSLREWQVAQGANYQEEVYRYDTRDSVLYFNHQKASQDSLNALITKIFTMQREAADCKIERTEAAGDSLMGGLMRAMSGGRHGKRPAYPSGGYGGRGGYGRGGADMDFMDEED